MSDRGRRSSRPEFLDELSVEVVPFANLRLHKLDSFIGTQHLEREALADANVEFFHSAAHSN